IVDLLKMLDGTVPWLRLLYLYPSGLTDALIDGVLQTGVPYFDLSLQHASRILLRAMRRWGDAARFLSRIDRIRGLDPNATFRSSFILGYPGETEDDQRRLVAFLEEAQLDWAGFFTFSAEEGTPALAMGDQVPHALALERLAECSEIQDAITSRRRDALVGQTRTVLVDSPGNARSVHEAPEIDGIIAVPTELSVGGFHEVVITGSLGTDLMAMPR
ncbi:MAG TPA: radical SAM protein, partial [Acidimicrobiales bacterium]|nr:radical SAM protein [Acidimicrobiales bacterium]